MAFLRRILAVAVALAALAPHARAQSPEYKLKAAYLCRFVDFVDWPKSAFPSTNSPLVIGVLGPDPFGGALDEVAEGQKSNGHAIQIRRFSSPDEIKQCQVLFVSPSEAPKLAAIMRELQGRQMLTVSDLNNFTAHGGIIRFFTDNNKVRFRINLEAARACQLTISSRLLQLADVVKEGVGAP
ncbi:MAG TPA: YfiR family protein [Verrucomicrobiae bacterium]|jgi:hypothetical protein|nr:YfiR family protein [Verrucomicrobiae bacterium]